MASLALIASLVVLFTLLIGPIAYLSSKLNLPNFIVYLLSLLSIINGIWFCLIGLPVWYLGLIPIYLGYISITKANKNSTQA